MAIINERKTRIAENGILSADAVRGYLENRLSDEERTELELLITKDPFAADALEGIRSAGNLTDTFLAIESVENNLRERSGASRKATDTIVNTIQLNWKIFAYAAGVIGVIISVGIIISYQSSKSKEEPIPEAEETTIPVTADSTITATEETQKDSVVTLPASTLTSSTTTVTATPNVQPPTQTITGKATSESDTINAMVLFNSGNYIDAEKKFDQILISSPNNYEAQYFSAVSAYINGNTNKAEKKFDYMLDNGLYVDGSKWYKANILLKKGDISAAKDILRSLSISTGMYKERAIKKLESLN